MHPTLNVKNLVKTFPASGGQVVNAVNGVSFSIKPGQIVALVGESGSGKSTIGRAVVRLAKPTAGQIIFNGQDISMLPEHLCRTLRKSIQIVFQDPWGSLNPRLKVQTLIEEPLRIHTDMSARERRAYIREIAERVHLNAELLSRFASELSGGQLQRVCIARAIATKPNLIVLDEPTSSLDLSVRAGILKLLIELKDDLEAGMLFISHDLGTVRLVSDHVLVLYLGQIVESGPIDKIFNFPAHPYTQTLLSSHLSADPRTKQQRHLLSGEIPSPINMPPGCSFSTRCPLVREECQNTVPELVTIGDGLQQAACIRIPEGTNKILS